MMPTAKNKEQNYISAVVYVDRADEGDIHFFRMLNQVLAEHFLKYELIAVTADEANHNDKKLRDFASEINMPLTLVHMSLKQPHEQCMNAGLDVSIGDYVYEFDTTDMPYAKEEIWNAYELAMKGNDIVTVCPSEEKVTSKLFYHIFNRHSNAEYKLRSDWFPEEQLTAFMQSVTTFRTEKQLTQQAASKWQRLSSREKSKDKNSIKLNLQWIVWRYTLILDINSVWD